MKKIILSLLFSVGVLFSAQAPNFDLTTIDGKNVSMSSFLASHKPTLVYFSASWCPTCAKNWPHINTLYKEYGDKINIVSISIDPSDTDEVLRKVAKKHNLAYPTVAGNPKVMVDFGVKSQATTVLVDTNGKIVYNKSGVLSLKQYKMLIDDLLSKSMMDSKKM